MSWTMFEFGKEYYCYADVVFFSFYFFMNPERIVLPLVNTDEDSNTINHFCYVPNNLRVFKCKQS